MDADVITIENSRSDEKLLSVFQEGVKYGAGIGPGVYDIHSPRIPDTQEIVNRIHKVLLLILLVYKSHLFSLFVKTHLHSYNIKVYHEGEH